MLPGMPLFDSVSDHGQEVSLSNRYVVLGAPRFCVVTAREAIELREGLAGGGGMRREGACAGK